MSYCPLVDAFLPGLLFWENLPGMTASPDTPCFAKRCPRPFSPSDNLLSFSYCPPPPLFSSLTVCKPLTARAAISLSNGLEAAAPYLPAGGLFFICVFRILRTWCTFLEGGGKGACYIPTGWVECDIQTKKRLNFMGWDINCFGWWVRSHEEFR